METPCKKYIISLIMAPQPDHCHGAAGTAP